MLSVMIAGIQELSVTQLVFYSTDEAKEGRDAFLEKRPPDFSDYDGLLNSSFFKITL